MSLNVNGYYPCFRGNESQINGQANNGQVVANQTQPLAMQPQLNTDTVELSGKKEEKTDGGMSTGAKVAIGTGVIAGLAVAADYIFAKGKHVKGILNSFKKNSKAVSEESRSTAKTEESIPQNIEQHKQDIPVKTNKSETIENTIPEETKGTQDSQAIKPEENVVNNVEPKKEKVEEVHTETNTTQPLKAETANNEVTSSIQEKPQKEVTETAKNETQNKIDNLKQEAEQATKNTKNEEKVLNADEADSEVSMDLNKNTEFTVQDERMNSICAWGKKTPNITDETKNAIVECENLTFDTPDLKLMKDSYDKDNVFDLGIRYAVVANNTVKAKGNAVVINEIPKMFKGINKEDLISKLDNLSAQLNPSNHGKTIKFTISGKPFTAKFIGGGCVNSVYSIMDKAGNEVCFRTAQNPYLCEAGQGIYSEFAIAQEATKAGVVDIPRLFMANPVGKCANGGCTKGAWQVLEHVDKNRKTPEGLQLFDWLESKGLQHCDFNSGTLIGSTFVDLGGICDKAGTYDSLDEIQGLLKGYQQGFSTSDMTKLF